VSHVLLTDRLELRPFRHSDAAEAHRILDGRRFNPGAPRTLEERAEILRYRIAEFERQGFGM
jgi:hypothetical protein